MSMNALSGLTWRGRVRLGDSALAGRSGTPFITYRRSVAIQSPLNAASRGVRRQSCVPQPRAGASEAVQPSSAEKEVVEEELNEPQDDTPSFADLGVDRLFLVRRPPPGRLHAAATPPTYPWVLSPMPSPPRCPTAARRSSGRACIAACRRGPSSRGQGHRALTASLGDPLPPRRAPAARPARQRHRAAVAGTGGRHP
jgi:hypothetical protein